MLVLINIIVSDAGGDCIELLGLYGCVINQIVPRVQASCVVIRIQVCVRIYRFQFVRIFVHLAPVTVGLALSYIYCRLIVISSSIVNPLLIVLYKLLLVAVLESSGLGCFIKILLCSAQHGSDQC